MEILRLLLFIAVTTFIGVNLLYLISFSIRRLTVWERVFIGYGTGIGFVSLGMFLFHFLDLKFSLFNIIFPWTLPVLLSLLLNLRYGKRKDAVLPENVRDKSRYGTLRVFLFCGISFEVIYTFFRALIKPLESYDAIAIYGIKAKVFYAARSIPCDYFTKLKDCLPHPDYPINIPLTETLAYLFMGNLNDQLVKIIFPLYFVGILTIFYFAVRRFASVNYSLIFTFLLATVPQFNSYATNGYLDLVLSYYVFASALFLFYWIDDAQRTQYLIVSAVMAGLACWTKNEGLLYCVANSAIIFLFFLFEKRGEGLKYLGYLITYLMVIAAITLPWLLAKKIYHIENSDMVFTDLWKRGIVAQAYKIKPIIYEFQKHIFGPKKWNILWLGALFVLVAKYKEVFKRNQRYITLALFFAISGYGFVYIVSDVEINYFLSRTWSRFLLHFLPIAVYWMARILKEDIEL